MLISQSLQRALHQQIEAHTMTHTPTATATLKHNFRSVALAGAAWAFIFGAINFYWGVGGTIGIYTLGERMAQQALSGDPELLFVNWLSVIGKIVIGLMLLALIRWQGSNTLLERLLSIGIWVVGVLLA